LIEDRKKIEEELRTKERILKVITENSTDVIWIMRVEGMRYIYMSDSVKVAGYNPQEILGNDLSYRMPSEYVDVSNGMLEDAIRKYKSGEAPDVRGTYELQLYNKKGELYWCEVSAVVLLDENDKPYEILGITRNIEERKKLEIELRDSEQQYKLIAENTSDAIWLMDIATMTYTYMSSSYVRISGMTAEEAVGRPLTASVTPKSVQSTMALLKDRLEKYQRGEIKHIQEVFEVELIHKNGNIISCEISGTIVMNEQGRPWYILGITRDISERKKLENALEDSERRYKLIAENTSDSIWTMDLNTLHFTFMSQSSIDTVGYTSDECLNMTLYDLMPREYVDMMLSAIDRESGKYLRKQISKIHTTYEAKIKHKNGQLVWVEISCVVIPDSSGALAEILGVSRRIDERKEYEHKLHQTTEELTIVNSTKDRFFSIIAHDLRNPLAALINIVEVFTDYFEELSKEDISRNINKLANSANHIYRLLENLLQWSRSSTGQIAYNPTDVEVDELIINVINTLATQARVKEIVVEPIYRIPQMTAYCDANMIETVIRNLVSNAIKFSNSKTTIRVIVEQYQDDNSYLLVSVSDNGVGMPNDKIDKLFKIDEKVSTIGTNNEAGTGLGLILCKEFIDKHECNIWVDSVLGKGSTFYFTLLKAQI
jgi:PAS domain S-box-containing protein